MPNSPDIQLLGNLEGKLDMLIDGVAEIRKDQREVHGKAIQLATQMQYSDSHERRIQELERAKSYLLGWFACAAAVAALVSYITTLFLRSKG